MTARNVNVIEDWNELKDLLGADRPEPIIFAAAQIVEAIDRQTEVIVARLAAAGGSLTVKTKIGPITARKRK